MQDTEKDSFSSMEFQTPINTEKNSKILLTESDLKVKKSDLF